MADMFIKQEDGTWTGLKVEIHGTGIVVNPPETEEENVKNG